MLRIVFITLFLSLGSLSFSQALDDWSKLFEMPKKTEPKSEKTVPEKPKEKIATYEIIDGDTIYIMYHGDVVVMDKEYKKKYDDHLYYIKRMLPYARLITQMSKDYDTVLEDLDKRRERKDFLSHQKDLAMAQFEDAVKKMSLNDGKYLVKLVHRESGMTTYDIISKFESGAKTFLWQAASRMGGADLKMKYDPTGEDKMIEEIMKKVDKGEIKIKTLKIDPKAIEKKEAAEAKEKEKKKAEKKKGSKKDTTKKSGTK